MAIDTQTKRRSVHGYAGPSAVIAPLVDGAALDEADRRAVAGLYRGITSGAGGTLTGTAGAYISPTTALYTGLLLGGPISITNVTNFESGGGESAVSFDHETPAGDYRLLTVIATYKDAVGVASLVFGSAGSGNGEFNSPYGIAVAADGSIYVADSANHRVQKFTSAGVYDSQFGSSGTGNGQFNTPLGIAIAGDGSIFVTDIGNNRVQKFTSAGAYDSQFGSNGSGNGEFVSPWGIAIASDGSIYVVDSGNSRIQKFTSAGVYASQWGSYGTGDSEFDQPTGIALDSLDNVYVVDNLNTAVKVFDAGGTFLRRWGQYGALDGEFDEPFGIAISPQGYVYITDANNSRIQQFDDDGIFINKWGVTGIGNGQFSGPYGIATGSAGGVYVADTGNNRVQKFAANLKLNAAYYAGTAMKVGPLVDSGEFFQAMYTMENPPVGNYEVALAAPTGPDVFLLTAISFSGVESAQTDYTGPAAGVAEQETSTTALQVSHNRTYPDYTLSIWSVLYEDSTTLTAAASNYYWLTRTAGTLNNAIGFRYIPTATTSNLTFGATASPAVTPRISAVLHLEAARPQLTGAAGSVIGGATLYAGEIQHEGQTLYGAAGSFITATTTLYGGTLDAALHGVYIAATTTLYAGAFDLEPGPDLFITGFFIGLGQPAALNGAYIDATTALYAGALEMELFLTGEDASYIVSTAALYAGTAQEIVTATGFIAAGQIIHV